MKIPSLIAGVLLIFGGVASAVEISFQSSTGRLPLFDQPGASLTGVVIDYSASAAGSVLIIQGAAPAPVAFTAFTFFSWNFSYNGDVVGSAVDSGSIQITVPPMDQRSGGDVGAADFRFTPPNVPAFIRGNGPDYFTVGQQVFFSANVTPAVSPGNMAGGVYANASGSGSARVTYTYQVPDDGSTAVLLVIGLISLPRSKFRRSASQS